MKILIISFLILVGSLASCVKLDRTPQGIIFSDQLNSSENIDKMVTAAYSALGNDNGFDSYTGLWALGDIRAGDAYKGGDGVGDQDYLNDFEVFQERPDNRTVGNVWVALYTAIGRVDDALARLDAVSDDKFPLKLERQAEMRFLRGHFYFLLKIYYKYIPWFDETVPVESRDSISNRSLSDDALWGKIADDFKFAADNLPGDQADVGRPTKWAAKGYLAKTLLYRAYKQNDKYQVSSIDQSLLTQVVSLCDEVIQSKKYALSQDFADNFLTEHENGPESIFAIQFSKDDGTPQGRLDWGHYLDYPMNPDYGCCAFHAPSQNLVNAFRTDKDGLPMFDDFNKVDVGLDDFKTYTFDPRLDHTVAIPGHPYKYEPYFVFQKSWDRSPQIYGYFLSMKETVAADDPSFQKTPPFMSSSKNQDIIRYDDILLWKAEALIELGKQDDALPIINAVRIRAANSTGLLTQEDGTYTSSYKIGTYQPGVNCVWTQDFARKALRWERRLEFAMEGFRFFDLVRWGITPNYIDTYITAESSKRQYLVGVHFQAGKFEYMPIPISQIDYSKGVLIQNAGY